MTVGDYIQPKPRFSDGALVLDWLPGSLPADARLPAGKNFEADCQEVVNHFGRAVETGEWSTLSDLFIDSSFWRDHLALTATMRTFYGKSTIVDVWTTLTPQRRLHSFELVPDSVATIRFNPGRLEWVQFRYQFRSETPSAVASGAMRLLYDENTSSFRIWFGSSTLEYFSGHEIIPHHVLESQSADVGKGINGSTLIDHVQTNGHGAFDSDEDVSDGHSHLVNGYASTPNHAHDGKGINGSTLPANIQTNGNGAHISDGHSHLANGHASTSNGSCQPPKVKSPVDVAIIGGSQNGLQTALACMKNGLKVRVFDAKSRVGDAWRTRYGFLSLHTPLAYGNALDHPYSPDTPEHVPCQVVGDHYESLARRFHIPVTSDAYVETSTYDEVKDLWTLKAKTPHGYMYAQAKFVVLAAGAGSQRMSMPDLPGRRTFRGEVLHSSQYVNGRPWVGGKAIVIGTANSGHDMAQDLYLSGVRDITLVQREKTFVIPQDHLCAVLGSSYPPDVSTYINERFAYGVPLGITRLLCAQLWHRMADTDEATLNALESNGFGLIKHGDLFAHTLGRGGGHYVDIGCSKLIGEGKVRMKRGSQAIGYTESGLAFADGTTLEADVVIFATGFRDKNLRDAAEELVGQEIGQKLDDVWGVDDEGEVKGTWRFTGHRRFIIMAGDVSISRFYAQMAALQIKGETLGVLPPPYEKRYPVASR